MLTTSNGRKKTDQSSKRSPFIRWGKESSIFQPRSFFLSPSESFNSQFSAAVELCEWYKEEEKEESRKERALKANGRK